MNTVCISVRLYDMVVAAVVAFRKFGVVRGSRCYCLWHRRCECYRDDLRTGRPHQLSGTTTTTLAQSEYNDAGMRGDVPPGTVAAMVAALDRDTVGASFMLLAAFMTVAVALGLAKELSSYRSHWLWMMNKDWLSEVNEYKEPELALYPLKQDHRGYYVHPVTGSRNIRLFDRGQEFIMNLLFFVNLPVMIFLYANGYSKMDCVENNSNTSLLSTSSTRENNSGMAHINK